MRWLLVEAIDRKGPLLLVLRSDQPLPNYPGFRVGRVHSYDQEEQARAAHERRSVRPTPRTPPSRVPRP